MTLCACGSNLEFSVCCEPYVSGASLPPTAESLMRSRYTAFTLANVDYLMGTVHPERRDDHDPDAIGEWARESEWLGLEIVETSAGQADDLVGEVEFVARFVQKGVTRRHHELAKFRKDEDRWFFYDGVPATVRQVVRQTPKQGRNDLCACGSGKKYKKCCG